MRFETPPAKQAQCDWSELGTIVDNGVELSLPVFVMIMGYSRKTFAAFSADSWRFNLYGGPEALGFRRSGIARPGPQEHNGVGFVRSGYRG